MKDDLHMHRALKYAADMKALEKQGRLWVLPCKLGEDLYVVGTKCSAGEISNDTCRQFLSCQDCSYNYEMTVYTKTLTKEFLCDIILDNKSYIIGETVFTNEELAKDALQKLLEN